jgi:hypothetical protein
MQAKTYGMGSFIAFIMVLLGSPWASTSLADEVWVYNTGTGPDICVEWDPEQDDPVHNEDFFVSFADTANPDVALDTGSLDWRVESGNGPLRDLPQATIFNIGAITAPNGQDYAVKIADGEGLTGAMDVESIVLTPSGDHHSSVASGSKISGDLTGNLTVKKDTSNNGGDVYFEIGGLMTGDIEAYTITNLQIGESLTGDVDATTITYLAIGDDMIGDIDVSGTIGDVDIEGSLTGNVAGTTMTDVDIKGALTGNVTATTITSLWIALYSGDVTGNITADDLYTTVIWGDYSGTVDVQRFQMPHLGYFGLFIWGDVSSTSYIGVGSIFSGAQLHFMGDLACDVDVDDNRGVIKVAGSVEQTVQIEVTSMVGDGANLASVQVGGAEYPGGVYFAGDLTLGNGITQYAAVTVRWPLTETASIDLTKDDMAGLLIVGRGGSGDILNGGEVTGSGIAGLRPVELALQVDSVDFSGTATFTGVASGSTIGVGPYGDLAGTLSITGNVVGTIDVDTDVTSDGEISITGNASGAVNIDGDLSGEIDIDGTVSGTIDVRGIVDSGADIFIDGDVSGDIGVDGDLEGDIRLGEQLVTTDLLADGSIDIGGALGTNGRIIVWGACVGDIIIADDTGTNSLIACYGGLHEEPGPPVDPGRIIVNNGRGDYDHNGTIHVGQAGVSDPLLDVTFDGYIMITDDTSGKGGDNLGTIRVIGCQPEGWVDEICICGGDYGTVTLTQDGCDYTTATWDCVVQSCPNP